MTLLALKAFFSGAARLFLAYWRLIVPCLILAYCLYAFNAMRVERDKAVTALQSYKQEVELKVKEQQFENAIKSSIAKKAIERFNSTHKQQIEAIKNDYLAHNKIDAITIVDLRSRLRAQIASDTFTMPKIDINTERTAAEWANSYATLDRQYETLVDACKVTTSDFNLLREWADAACEQVGCE